MIKYAKLRYSIHLTLITTVIYCFYSLFLIYKYIEMNKRVDVNIRDGRSAIKQGQIDILEALYKYRFGSRHLIAKLLSINENTLYKKLIVLVKHELIGSRLDNKSKIKGIPVAYYLTPKGLKFLQALEKHTHVTDKVIKASYRDKVTSEATILHAFDVLSQVLNLKNQYSQLKAYLRRDMSRFSYFPKTPPDAFLSIAHDNVTRRYFFDYIPSSQERKLLFQRIYSYLDFFDNGGWNITGTEIPILLFVTENATMERRIRRIAKGVINKIEINDEIIIYTTTKKALENPNREVMIWSELNDPDELVSLI
ncbi:hypothetical protein CVV43_04095 [Candidatus Saccharibacteria bacterium HGW-Saccharibacteria-1]|nr:MAG: hypothetical protein CVV43_04095 [Candidatus Saccharibacteria bacterium HGW-Saccharibacteria-1]